MTYTDCTLKQYPESNQSFNIKFKMRVKEITIISNKKGNNFMC